MCCGCGLSSVDYSADVAAGRGSSKQKLGRCEPQGAAPARYLLGNLHDFDPAAS